jgi:hypothetical protein
VVDIVLGVSMAPTKVRMVLVEGENADGVTVDQDNFDVAAKSPATAHAQVISAILGTRESAAEGGYELLSSGVTWTDSIEAAALRDALAAHKIENVVLVSAFMAAAALAQAVGNSTNYARTALLFVEPYTATLAVVDTADGSIADVRRELLPDDDDRAVGRLVEMVSGAESLKTHPEAIFVVGSGVDIPLIKPALEAATSLALSVAEEPEMALAQGAALASANSPLFAASTAARAYALDHGTGYRPEYRVPYLVADDKPGIDNVAYSAVSDDVTADEADDADRDESPSRRRPVLLVGSSLSIVLISAVVALEIALAISIRPTVALRPSPNENIIVPIQEAPAPAIVKEPEIIRAPTPVAAPRPIAPHLVAPAPVAAPPPVPVPVAPPPVLVPMAPRVPTPEPRLVPRAPLLQPRAQFPEPQVPRERGLVPRLGGAEPPRERGLLPGLGGGPRERGLLPGLGGGNGGFRGPFGGGGIRGPFGGGLFGGGWRGGFGGDRKSVV